MSGPVVTYTDSPNSPSDTRELLVMANIRAYRDPRGCLLLTRKFIEGVASYARNWPGPVTVLIRISDMPFDDLDPVEIVPERLSFGLEMRPETMSGLAQRLHSAALVLAFLSPDEAALGTLCKAAGIPLIYYSEYSLEVEKQIIDANTRNPLSRWRRKLWATQAERKRLRALHLAAGLQCSGSPTFDVYRAHNANVMIFFDNRVRREAVIDLASLAAKTASLRQARPLRLVFGGRLIRMKGVHHLPEVALHLKRAGVLFHLSIYGDGDLRAEVQRSVDQLGVQDQVSLAGVLDFESGWLPVLQQQADIFVCCHPQGDPSSTYPEVMSCGVPIVGYDNAALSGIVALSGAGWVTPLNNRRALATKIASLASCRDEIAEAAIKAREFGCLHSFEMTFSARVEHMKKLSRLPGHAKGETLAQDGIA